MITDDQVAELFANANPVPMLEALYAEMVVDDGAQDSTSERSRGMVTAKTEQREGIKRRRPLLVGVLGAVLAAVIALPLFLTSGEQPVTEPTGEELAIRTAEALFAALTMDDVDGAMALMEAAIQEDPRTRTALEFFAALPGTKTLTDCAAAPGTANAFSVSCTTSYNGPLMRATGEDSTGVFNVEDGLLITMFTPGSRDTAAAAFAQYASQTRPEAYEQACSPESYEIGSIRTQSSGWAFAGPCGELWAEVAEDAAAWVEAGRPALSEDS
jgi:hypothetical protein